MKHAAALRNRRGSTLVLSLILVTMFSALVAALAAFSGTNVQLAENLRRHDIARGCAESGLEVVRYWMSQVQMSGTTADSLRFSTLATTLQGKLNDAGATNILNRLTSTASTITMTDVPLNSNKGQLFSAVLTKIDNNNVQLEVTGSYRSIEQRIRSNYQYHQRADTVFNFGVASKGPLALSGNIEMTGSTIAVESNAYIECDPLLALSIIGNSMIYGDVSVVNPLGYVFLQGGQAGIGGATGDAAMQHVDIGAPPVEFPELDPNEFYGYATNVMSPTASVGADGTCDNLRIPANRNPTFSGGTVLRGVVYIEAPNVVTFGGSVDVTAIIVTNGDPADNSGTNQLKFNSSITGHPVDQLPLEPKFADLQQKTGTFIVAPGFKLTLGGSFTTLCGAIAANGIELSGGAGGTINGSLINYSSAPMTLGGNSDLFFNRSGLTKIPAGFVPRIVMLYDPSSYMEPAL
jgi:Tfp pilus assembly protein PilX